MLSRSYDGAAVQDRLDAEPNMPTTFDARDWAKDHTNIILQADEDYGLFINQIPGVFAGHYLFKSRGRDAIRTAREMLREMFRQYAARVIIGLVPCTNRASAWVTRQLGFEHHGTVMDTDFGECHLFILASEP